MSWWPDPGLSCVLCWRKSFVQKSWTANFDANAKISNGGDKACETKNKRDRWHCLIRFELGFERNPPIWSWLLEEMLGFFNSWLLLLRAASGQNWQCCCYRYHHDLDLYKLKLNPTSPHIERMLKRWKVVKRFLQQKCLSSPDCSRGHPLVGWSDSVEQHIFIYICCQIKECKMWGFCSLTKIVDNYLGCMRYEYGQTVHHQCWSCFQGLYAEITPWKYNQN